MDAAVGGFQLLDERWQVRTTRGPMVARAILDARGRRARRSDSKGPPLTAWSIRYKSGTRGAPLSGVAALEHAWCWVARTNEGSVALQFVAASAQKLSRERVREWIFAAARALPDLGCIISPAVDFEPVGARAAIARYTRPSQGPGFLRIGDAAVAMDPLSGNGVHEALRSARVAVAALNSYLQDGQWVSIAQFMDERAREFWGRTASAYAQAAREAAVADAGPGRFEMRPVLDGDRIDLRRVWVSAEWPRGVWQVNGCSLDRVPLEFLPSVLQRLGRPGLRES
jgi:flavin-dependent dehydrogenase